MVGRFIKNEEIGFLQHETAKDYSGRFATGKSVCPLKRIVAAEQHLAEQSAQFLLGSGRVAVMQPFDDADAEGDGVPMILRKVSNGNLMTPFYRPCIDWKIPVGCVDKTGGIANQRLFTQFLHDRRVCPQIHG